jgi:YesN/AraC family two-component response regulator
MGGSIRAESVLGKGSAFTANIRCERCTAAPAADIPADEPQESVPALLVSPQSIVQTVAQPEAPLILLIEDNSDMRQFLRESMPKGYRIAEASEGAEGIEMALNLVPDLVISDLVMLQKNGFEVVEALKNSSATSHVPIILLTGQSGQESKLKGLRYGADIYLTKPFDSDELTAHIENLLASRKRLQAYFSQESPVTSTVKQLSSPENEFLQKLIQLIEENLDNDDMDAEAFAKAMFVSRSQLHRKISALTGLSLTEFVRNHRLDRAKEMLARNEGSVLEIAWRVGFRNAKYFSTSFKERFGQTPSSVTPKGA